MSKSWKEVGKKIADVAPILGGVLGGPAGSSIGTLVASVLGTKADPTEVYETLEKNPELLIKMKELEHEERKHLRELKFQETRAYLGDIQNARASHSGNNNVFNMGIVILGIYAVVVIGSLCGIYQLLTGGMPIEDASIVAAISTFLGSLIGYVSSNAQQVVSFYFGSSKGSADKTDAMSSAIGNLAIQKPLEKHNA